MLVAGLLLSPTWGLADEPKENPPGSGPIEMKNVFECLKACNALPLWA